MIMKKIFTLSALFVAFSLFGQEGLDPTVRVTGEYKAQVSSEDIPHEEVFLPDSIADFDTHFDYSVFDKPYQGSYEFSPYLLDLRPRKQSLHRNHFVLNMGLGYTLHPRVDAYWEPEVGDSCLNMSVYASHRSYLGKYASTIGIQSSSVEPPVANLYSKEFSGGAFESFTRAGFKGRYDFKKSFLTWDVAYLGIHNGEGDAPPMRVPGSEDYYFNRGYNRAMATVNFFSAPRKPGEIFYDVNLDVDFARDNFFNGETRYLQMGGAKIYGGLGDMVVENHGFRFDFDLAIYMLNNSFSKTAYLTTHAQHFSVTPRYLLNFKKFKMDLGVNVAYVSSDSNSQNFKSPQQIVYPDVTITYDPWRQWATFYLKAKGGINMDRYDDLLAKNHHFNYLYNQNNESLLGNTVERVNLSLGVEGKISSRFSYEAKLGYKVMGNAPMEYLKVSTSFVDEFYAGLAYTPYQSFYAGVGLFYESESFDAQARAKYQGTYNLDNNSHVRAIFGLPPFLVDVRMMYNWKRRIFAGVSLEAQGARRACLVDGTNRYDYSIKPFYNLGLDFQYKFSNLWTFWLHVDNLLFQEIQRNLFYAQKGAEFSVGFTLNIR